MEWCAMVGCPIVGINDSGGARIQDAVTSLAWYAELGRRHELLSGLVPQISIILGKCAGERCIRRSRPIWWWRCATRVTCSSPAPTSSRTSPVRTSASTSWGRRPPGELRQHPSGGGVRGRRIPVRAGLSVVSAVQLLRQTAGRQPGLEPEITGHDLELDSIVPDSDNMAYDMHEVLLRIFDDGDFSTSLPRPGRRSSPATRGWTGGPLVWWPTSPCTCRGRSTTRRPTRPHGSSGLATRSTSRWCSSWTHRGFARGGTGKERDHQARWEVLVRGGRG